MPHAEASDIRVPSGGGCFFINSVHYGNFEFPHVFCLMLHPYRQRIAMPNAHQLEYPPKAE
jgi:hypothetical protein